MSCGGNVSTPTNSPYQPIFNLPISTKGQPPIEQFNQLQQNFTYLYNQVYNTSINIVNAINNIGGSGNGAFYGDGSDGDLVLANNTTSTMGREMYYANVTIDSTSTLLPAGNALFVSGKLILNGVIAFAGHDAPVANISAGPAGPAVGGSGLFGDNNNQGGPGTPSFAGGNGLTTQQYTAGGTGGAGGHSAGNAGGLAGPGTIPTSKVLGGAQGFRNIYRTASITQSFHAIAEGWNGGTGGGGGAGPGPGGNGFGGGGGGGGGFIVILAAQIDSASTGTINAKGGNGADGFTTGFAYGGGGGGGGGVIVLVSGSALPAGLTTNVKAGLGGSAVQGIGSGAVNGANGTDGSVVFCRI